MQTQIGLVKIVKGAAIATSEDGSKRLLNTGDPVYASDQITNISAEPFEILFNDGSRLLMGMNSQANLTEQYWGESDFSPIDATAKSEAVQKAILAGEDPSKVAEPPAAGEDGLDPSNILNEAYVIGVDNAHLTPRHGHDTIGLTQSKQEWSAEDLLQKPFIRVSLTSTKPGDVTNPGNGDGGSGASPDNNGGSSFTSGTAVEGNPISFTVSLDQLSSADTTVYVEVFSQASDNATPGQDYEAASEYAVVIPAGSLSSTFVVNTLDDAIYEPDETFSIRIMHATNDEMPLLLSEPEQANITSDDPLPTLIVSPPNGNSDARIEVMEGEPAIFSVHLSNPSYEPITIQLSTQAISATAGEDYNSAIEVSTDGGKTWTESNTQTIAPGSTEVLVRVSTIDDSVDEPLESFSLQASAVDPAQISNSNGSASGNAFILDNDEPPPLAGASSAQVAEAALDTDESQGSGLDPAIKDGISQLASGDLTVLNGTISNVRLVSGPSGENAELAIQDDQLVLTAEDRSWTLAVNTTTGAYEFALLAALDHPSGDDAAFSEGIIPLDFEYTVSGPGGVTTGSLTIDVRDDRPDLDDISVQTQDATTLSSNIVVVLDRSGSMGEDPGVNGYETRIDLARAALAQMLDAYALNGDTHVLVVDFARSSENSGWVSIEDAIAYMEGLVADGGTNYKDALAETQVAFSQDTPVADQNLIYFISDGIPTVGGEPDYAQWQTFRAENNFVETIAVGVGSDVSADDPDLVAITQSNNGAEDSPVVVTDEGQLIDTLVGSVAQTLHGNVFNDTAAGSFGADGPGHIQTIQIDNTTFRYDPIASEISRSNAATISDGPRIFVHTALGGTLLFNFENGNYHYTPANVSEPVSEQFQLTVVDGDGDRGQANLQIDIIDAASATEGASKSSADAVMSKMDDGSASILTASLFSTENETSAPSDPGLFASLEQDGAAVPTATISMEDTIATASDAQATGGILVYDAFSFPNDSAGSNAANHSGIEASIADHASTADNVITLDAGADVSITLSANDVLNFADENNVLYVHGDRGDQIAIEGTWSQVEAMDNTDYSVYQGVIGNESIHLYIDQQITVDQS